MVDLLQVSTATEKREEPERLARSVVEGRLAAGAQIIGPVISTFWRRVLAQERSTRSAVRPHAGQCC
ncbi:MULTISPECIES: divalent cation tolerance protein CutA [unclassified Streptomyces]|uniref:divalent cation tolerance protein CutA n=1 Tax=unclassified Streptomyces TaxID=2593676 RepID=UPI003815B2F9